MSRFDGGANEFHLYFIPVSKEDKAIKETIKTAPALNKAGAWKRQNCFIPNRITPSKDVEKVLEPVLCFVKETNIGRIDKISLYTTVKFMNS